MNWKRFFFRWLFLILLFWKKKNQSFKHHLAIAYSTDAAIVHRVHRAHQVIDRVHRIQIAGVQFLCLLFLFLHLISFHNDQTEWTKAKMNRIACIKCLTMISNWCTMYMHPIYAGICILELYAYVVRRLCGWCLHETKY